MKKVLLVMSIVCFAITSIMCWICSFWTGLLMTFVFGGLISFAIYLINNNPRLWISIVMFILSLLLLFWGSANLGYRTAVYLTEDEKIADEIHEDVTEENSKDIAQDEEEIEVDETEMGNEVIQEVPVEKVIVKETIKEVPVEKEVIKEVQKIEYVEVEKDPEPTSQPVTPTPTPTPIPNNVNYGGPTTVYGYGYQNGYGYGNNYNSTTIKIKGATEVVAGDSETYTISGVNSISESKLDISENVSYRISGNKITVYFDEDLTSGYCLIKYGSAKLKVDIIPCD